MLQRLKSPEPFGKAGLTVAILALVMAMAGGAYAAGGLTGKQKKEVEKIAKKFAGKPGAPGANGTNGSPGAKGDAGVAGSNGTNGVSVTSAKINPGPSSECKAGGTKFTSASGTEKVCNGENGTTGFTKTLPSKATETGVWALGQLPTEGVPFAVDVPISFNIPLAAALDEAHTHFVPVLVWEGKIGSAAGELCEGKSGPELEACEKSAEEIQEDCPSVSPAEPLAEPGFLCAYISLALGVSPNSVLNPATPFGSGASSTGADLHFAGLEPLGQAHGTYAVTAP